jgi:superfamily II DNA/RNA helicase
MSDFKSLKLLPEIMEAIEKVGYKNPTPIQAQAIPHLLEGKELLKRKRGLPE